MIQDAARDPGRSWSNRSARQALIVAVRYALRLAAQLLSGETLPLPSGWPPGAPTPPAGDGRPPRPPR